MPSPRSKSYTPGELGFEFEVLTPLTVSALARGRGGRRGETALSTTATVTLWDVKS